MRESRDMREKNRQGEALVISRSGRERLEYFLEYIIAATLFAIILTLFISTYARADIGAAYYVYNLSDFGGTIPYNWAGLSVDKSRNEIYVVYKNDVEVFNDQGMKIYSFGDDENISGVIYDVAVQKDGTIYLLLIDGDKYSVIRCNYRGEVSSRVVLKNVPADFAGIFPNRIIYMEGDLYLADMVRSKKVVITDMNGNFKGGYDISSLIGLEDAEGKPGQEKEIAGFSVDRDGNMLLTVPTIFRAFRISPDRKVETFGEAGNIPGKFSVVAGIASDESGNIYITDTLKSVVMIYDRNFRFIMEFGYRGDQPGNLIAPRNMVVNDGHIYVSQSRDRGISVYRIVNN